MRQIYLFSFRDLFNNIFKYYKIIYEPHQSFVFAIEWFVQHIYMLFKTATISYYSCK